MLWINDVFSPDFFRWDFFFGVVGYSIDVMVHLQNIEGQERQNEMGLFQ